MGLLLDTCALLWIAQDQPVSPTVRQEVHRGLSVGHPACVSPISAWEVGLLAARNRINLTSPPALWFAAFLARSGFALCSLTPEVLIAASFLPGELLRDPADRIICATAREHGLTVVTRDRAILDYAAAGHCRALAC